MHLQKKNKNDLFSAMRCNFSLWWRWMWFPCSPPEEVPSIPILSSLSITHASDVLDMPVDPNEPTYCLCHQVSYGEMIGCDNPDVSHDNSIIWQLQKFLFYLLGSKWVQVGNNWMLPWRINFFGQEILNLWNSPAEFLGFLNSPELETKVNFSDHLFNYKNPTPIFEVLWCFFSAP